MAVIFTEDGAKYVREIVFSGSGATPQKKMWLAVFQNSPVDVSPVEGWDGSNGIAYARVAVNSNNNADGNNTGWADDNGGGVAVKNARDLVFSAVPTDVSGGDVTLTHWALYDAATAGNLLFAGALDSSKTLEPNDILSMPASNLAFTFPEFS